jgi:hypothetical protein
MTVTAAPMQHTIPCVGYVTTEQDRAGHLDLSSVLPHIEVSGLSMNWCVPHACSV